MKKIGIFTVILSLGFWACGNGESENKADEQAANNEKTKTTQGESVIKKLSQSDIEEKVMQVKGTWKLQAVKDETAEWKFEDDKFVHKGKTPSYDYEEKGIYHITRIASDTVLLYLDEIEGPFGQDSRVISMVMNKEGNSASLNNQMYKKQ